MNIVLNHRHVGDPATRKIRGSRLLAIMLLAATPVTGAYAQATPVADLTIEELMRTNVEAVFGASRSRRDYRPTPSGRAAVLRSTLERCGLEIVVVHDGADAWKALQADDGIGLSTAS